jgi:hypothetical protein
MKYIPSTMLNAMLAVGCALLLSACAQQPTHTTTRVSDSAAQAQAGEGVIELEWQAPRDRINGTPLLNADIAGYRIYIGNAPGQYTRTVDIDNPQATRYVLQGLKAGEEYYLAITTIDRQGRESPKSGEAHMAAAPLGETQTAKSAH